MNKQLLFLLIMVTVLFASKTDILGVYRLPNGIDVKIIATDSTYNGVIVNLNGYRTVDSKNPDKKRRDEPLMGKAIITGLQYNNENGMWEGGKLYFTDKGITVNLKIESVSDEGLHAVGSKLIMRKKIVFRRVN